jgi:phage tail-like protein
VDGAVIKGITEVSGLKMDQDVIELKQNTASGKYVIKKLPGRPKSGEVTLTRGLTADNSFQKWAKDVRLGKMGDARKNCMVTVYDSADHPIRRYKLTNAWPKSLEIGSLKAGDTSALTEKLILTYEQMDVE